MRVILIKGQSAYGALPMFVDNLGEAFAQRGYEPIIIDLMEGASALAAIKAEASTGSVALVFTFCILGEYRDEQGRSLSQIFNAPHVVQHVDYPLTQSGRLDGTAAETALLVVDKTHVDAIKSVYGEDRFAHVAFSPHAAIGSPTPLEESPEAFAKSRPIPILFTGTFYKPVPPPWEKFPSAVKSIFQSAVDRALAVEWMAALDALDASLRDGGLDPTAPDIALIRKLATYVHEHVRAHRRYQLLKAAAKVGLPIHIYGKGYDRQLYRFKNVTFGGEADLQQAIGLMKQSRVVLNINANFGAGSHERPLTALLAGAVGATDYSRFYAAHFVEGREIAIYRWKSLEVDLASIGALSENPAAALDMVRAGQPKVAAEHRWSNRVDSILKAADVAKSKMAAAA